MALLQKLRLELLFDLFHLVHQTPIIFLLLLHLHLVDVLRFPHFCLVFLSQLFFGLLQVEDMVVQPVDLALQIYDLLQIIGVVLFLICQLPLQLVDFELFFLLN